MTWFPISNNQDSRPAWAHTVRGHLSFNITGHWTTANQQPLISLVICYIQQSLVTSLFSYLFWHTLHDWCFTLVPSELFAGVLRVSLGLIAQLLDLGEKCSMVNLETLSFSPKAMQRILLDWMSHSPVKIRTHLLYHVVHHQSESGKEDEASRSAVTYISTVTAEVETSKAHILLLGCRIISIRMVLSFQSTSEYPFKYTKTRHKICLILNRPSYVCTRKWLVRRTVSSNE